MAQSEIRTGFDQMIRAALDAGNHAAVANLEIAREYFTNPAFKAALEDHSWQMTR